MLGLLAAACLILSWQSAGTSGPLISSARPPTTAETHLAVPLPLADVRKRLASAFNPVYDASADEKAKRREIPAKFARFRLVPFGHELFPNHTALQKESTANLDIGKYEQLTDESKAADIFLYRDVDYFWQSDYVDRAGAVLPFGCSFIIHFGTHGPRETAIEVLEYQPTVRNGKRWGLGQHGIDRFVIFEPVSPTSSDTRGMVDYLSRALAKN